MRLPDTVSVARASILAGGAAALFVLALLLAGDPVVEPESPPAAVPVWTSPTPAEAGTTRSPTRHPATGVPIAVRIPVLGVDSGVDAVPLGTGGVLVPPADPSRVGWWSGGAQPGSVGGAVVLAGHSVRLGDGVFDDLADLEPGDRVRVATHRGEVSYRVGDVGELSTEHLAAVSSELFSQSGAGRLVLVTCADWSAGDYRGNTVVLAERWR